MSTSDGGPTMAAGLLAIAAAAVAASLTIAIFIGLQVWPFVLIVTAAIVMTIGLPLFALIRRAERLRMLAVSAGGFATGAFAPASLMLFGPAADQASVSGVATVIDGSYTVAGWLEIVNATGGFGLVGIIAAILAWRLSLWLSARSRRRRLAAVGLIITTATSLATPSFYVDRSCHNPLRAGGRSIAVRAGFNLSTPMRDWPAVDREVRRFAREAGWSLRSDVRPHPDFPWFQDSLCTEAGTVIMVINHAPDALALAISVYQPRGGDGWQAPLRALQRRLEARWPGAVSYDDRYGSPRPPWAVRPPTSAPSSAAR